MAETVLLGLTTYSMNGILVKCLETFVLIHFREWYN